MRSAHGSEKVCHVGLEKFPGEKPPPPWTSGGLNGNAGTGQRVRFRVPFSLRRYSNVYSHLVGERSAILPLTRDACRPDRPAVWGENSPRTCPRQFLDAWL
jgi:hypothetical protein